MHDGKPKLLSEEAAKMFASIDFSSMEARIVAAVKLDMQIEEDQRMLDAGLTPTGRMTQCEPIRYLGHTYNSREIKD